MILDRFTFFMKLLLLLSIVVSFSLASTCEDSLTCEECTSSSSCLWCGSSCHTVKWQELLIFSPPPNCGHWNLFQCKVDIKTIYIILIVIIILLIILIPILICICCYRRKKTLSTYRRRKREWLLFDRSVEKRSKLSKSERTRRKMKEKYGTMYVKNNDASMEEGKSLSLISNEYQELPKTDYG